MSRVITPAGLILQTGAIRPYFSLGGGGGLSDGDYGGVIVSGAGTVMTVVIRTVTIIVPYGTRDALIAVADALVASTSKILQTIGAYLQTDTNDPSDCYMSVEDVGTGTFNVRVRASGQESIGGPFKFFYILG